MCFITEQSQCYNVPSSAECAVNSWSQRKSWSRVLYTLCTHYVHWAGVRVGGLCKKYTYSVYTVMSVHCASHQAKAGDLYSDVKNYLSNVREKNLLSSFLQILQLLIALRQRSYVLC